jgi:hypothetical protein
MFIPCLKLFIFLQRSQLIRRRRIGERIVAATKPKLFLFQSRLSLIFVAARHSGDKRFTAAAAAISCLRLLGWLRGFRDGGRKSRGGKRKLDMEWMRCPRSDACGLGHGWPEPFCANRHGRQGEVALRVRFFFRNPLKRDTFAYNPLFWIAINNRDPYIYKKSLTVKILFHGSP